MTASDSLQVAVSRTKDNRTLPVPADASAADDRVASSRTCSAPPATSLFLACQDRELGRGRFASILVRSCRCRGG
jgi:hypothetical protein